jgi:Leucine-rich repeat (LRR) protein
LSYSNAHPTPGRQHRQDILCRIAQLYIQNQGNSTGRICVAGLQELSLASNPLITDDDNEELGVDHVESAGDRPPSPKHGAFPRDSWMLSKLKVLTLNCCDLEMLPEAIGELTSLHTLYVSDNRAEALQHAFFMLPSHTAYLQV